MGLIFRSRVCGMCVATFLPEVTIAVVVSEEIGCRGGMYKDKEHIERRDELVRSESQPAKIYMQWWKLDQDAVEER